MNIDILNYIEDSREKITDPKLYNDFLILSNELVEISMSDIFIPIEEGEKLPF